MARSIGHINSASQPRKLYLGFDHLGARPGERIKDYDWHTVPLGVDVSHDLVERPIRDLFCGAGNVFQIALGIEIVHRDSRPWHHIVKMIEQQILPRELELILRIPAAEERSQG